MATLKGTPILRDRLVAGSLEERRFQKSLNPDVVGLGATPFDQQTPDVIFERRLLVGLRLDLPFPNPTTGVNNVQTWVIADPALPAAFPSHVIRVREGQLVHTRTQGAGNSHTIHHHGIEPTPANDGVGHDSFEIGSYTYQWLASTAGTYFYHCHKNTVLHFEMGLYGLIIVDPPTGPGRFSCNDESLPGFTEGGPAPFTAPYDVEAAWVCDDFDSRWHELGTQAFMYSTGADPNIPNGVAGSGWTNNGILHDFRPDIFSISGVFTPTIDGSVPITNPAVAVTARVGQTVLIRLLNASYTINRYTLGADALVVAMDGEGMGVPPFGTYNQPFTVPANTPFSFTVARRWDLVVRPTSPGIIPFQCEFLDWVTGARRGLAKTQITVQP